ncbi:MAG: hypothetical protein LBN25_03875 [Christensenellaceae bacterium]|jgi:hypothetical protein|nr:hypothetical protein [Christensenellaceae bacterium]
MKKTKFTIFLVAVIAALSTVFALSACGKEEAPDNSEGVSITVVVLQGDAVLFNKTAETTQSYLRDAITADFTEIGLVGTESEYGFWTEKVNIVLYFDTPNAETSSLDPKSADEFIAYYSSIDDPLYTSTEFGTKLYDGKTFASNALGVSEMPVFNGAIYIITVATFGN